MSIAIRFVRLPEVLIRTGLSRSSIFAKMSQGEFPKHYKLGLDPKSRAAGWKESDLDDFLRRLVEAGN